MPAYTYRMPAGVVGALSRATAQDTVETHILSGSVVPAAYGRFVKLTAGAIQDLQSGDAATVVYGLYVRPTVDSVATSDPLGVATPPASGLVNIMRRGWLSVFLKLGTAVKGGQVYVVTTAGGTVVVGDIVTSASPAGGGTAVAVSNCIFTGPADANGITEVAFNI